MWIHNENNTSEHYNEDVMGDYGPVSYSDAGTTQVPDELGEKMIENYDVITKHEADNE